MDILRKMFSENTNAINKDNKKVEDEELNSRTDVDTDDDDGNYAFEIFTSPLELQKHFERQMQQIIDAFNQFEDEDFRPEKNLKEEFLKPGFEKNTSKLFQKFGYHNADTDLDGEIIPDELHSLMEKFKNTEDGHEILPSNDNRLYKLFQTKKKLTDEEKILGRIHGTLTDEEIPRNSRVQTDLLPPISPIIPKNNQTFGVFDDSYKGPKLFRQSVITKTIRKPDGTSETTQIRQDSNGNKKTTITRTKNGKSETFTTYDSMSKSESEFKGNFQNEHTQLYSDRNIYVSKEGYALPRNMW